MKPTLKKLSYVLLVLALLLTAIACKPSPYETINVITQSTNTYYVKTYQEDAISVDAFTWWTSTGWGYTKHTGRLQIAGTFTITTEQFQVGVLK